MDEVNLKVIQVHERLIEEFNLMKKELETTTGYPIRGGNPVISLIVADLLKKRRDKNTDNVRIEIKKVKGCKKNDILFL